MSRIDVNLTAITTENDKLTLVQQKVMRVFNGSRDLSRLVTSAIQDRNNIRARLKNVSVLLSDIDTKMQKLQTGVSSYVRKYEDCEFKLKVTKISDPLKNQNVNEQFFKVNKNWIDEISSIDFSQFDFNNDFFGDRNGFWDKLIMSISGSYLPDVIFDLLRGEKGTKYEIKRSILRLLERLTEDSGYGVTPPDLNVQWAKINIGNVADIGLVIQKIEFPVGSFLWEFIELYETLDENVKEMVINHAGGNIQKLVYLYAIRDSLLNSGFADQHAIDAVNELIAEYENFTASTIAKMRTEVLITELEALYSWAMDTNPATMVIDTFGDLYQFSIDVSGVTELGDEIKDVYAINFYYESLRSEFNQYRSKIIFGNYTQQDVEKAKMLFELCKSTKIEQYTLMLSITKDNEQKKRLREGINQLKQLTFPRI